MPRLRRVLFCNASRAYALYLWLQQKQIEQEEEYITNKLMKRLDQLKKEKAVLASEVSV